MTRKKVLFIAASVFLVVMFVGLVGLGLYGKQQDKKLADAKQAVKHSIATYDFANKKPDELSSDLIVLSTQLRDATVYTRAPGQADFMKKSAELQNTLTHMSQMAEYSGILGKVLTGQQLGGKFISSDDALKQADKWQKFNDELKKSVQYVQVRKFNDVLVASSANQVLIAKKASDAYKANDETALKEQAKAANDELAKMQAVYSDFYALIRAQQAIIIKLANEL